MNFFGQPDFVLSLIAFLGLIQYNSGRRRDLLGALLSDVDFSGSITIAAEYWFTGHGLVGCILPSVSSAHLFAVFWVGVIIGFSSTAWAFFGYPGQARTTTQLG